MKKYKYTIIGVLGLLTWLGETAYFGWNREPLSVQEGMFDTISLILIVWGIVGDILTNITIQKVMKIIGDNVNVTNTVVNLTESEGNRL